MANRRKQRTENQYKQKICGCISVNLRNYTIKQQISTGLISVSFIILLSLCLVSIISIVDLGNQTSKAAMDNLRLQIETNARNFSTLNADEISATLQRRAAAANLIAYAMSDFYLATELTFDKDAISYFDEQVTAGSPVPGVTFNKNDNNFPLYKTKETSSYYIPKTTNTTAGTPARARLNGCYLPKGDTLRQYGTPMDESGCKELTTVLASDPLLVKQIQRSVKINRYFKDFSKKIPDIYAIYFGFRSSGLFRQFPGSNDNSDGNTPRTYDPRKRPWYLDAMNGKKYASSTTGAWFGQTIITAPYQDFWSKVWMVTVAKAVYDDVKNLVGVLGIDVSIKTIQDEILKVHFLESGYVILTESASRSASNMKERLVVSAPNFESYVTNGNVYFKDVLPSVASNSTLFNSLWSETNVKYYSERENDEEKNYLLAYSSAGSTMFRERYTVFIVIPEGEALGVLPTLEKTILETIEEVVGIVSATSITTGLVTLLIIITVTNSISKPVQAMVQIAQSIVKGAAEQNLVKDFERQERAMKAVRDYAGVKEGFTNADAGRRKINNEMQLLARSFLTMTSGLKRDANREKALVKHPINPYHMDQESEFMGDFIDQNLAVEVEAKQM